MKKHITLTAALFCSLASTAQSKADSRLVATSNYEWLYTVFIPKDSSVFFYSGNNGWDYATQGWKFDIATTLTYDPANMLWTESKAIKQTLANDRIMKTTGMERISGGWQDDKVTNYTYTNGLIATKEFYSEIFGSLYPISRQSYLYNNDDRITETINEGWDGIANQWIHSYRIANHYNASNQLDSSLTQTWNASNNQWINISQTIYHYNNSKQIDSTLTQDWDRINNKWIEGSRSYALFIGGRRRVVSSEKFVSGAWIDQSRTYFGYEGNNITLEEWERWYAGSGWEKAGRNERVYNSADQLVEQRNAFWTGVEYRYSTKTSYTYNPFGRVLTEDKISWDAYAASWDEKTTKQKRNYYEAYTNDVKTVAANLAELHVFPMPAKNEVTVAVSFKQAQPVSIILRDMSGKMVKHITDQAGTQYSTHINVADLPAGNYILNITGTTELAATSISITH